MEKNISHINMNTTLDDIRIIEVPKIADVSGNLSFIEKDIIPFDIKRVYYLYDVRSDGNRIGHASRTLQKMLIALNGSFDVVLSDGTHEKVMTLNKPNIGLLIVPGIWRELQNFSSGAVCLIVASEIFDEQDYIRSYDDFKLFKNRIT